MDPQQPQEPTPPAPGSGAETPDDVVAEEAMATESPAAVPDPGPDDAATQADVPVVAPAEAAAAAAVGVSPAVGATPSMPPAGPPPAAPPPGAPPPAAAPAPGAWQAAPVAEVGPAPGVRFAPHGGRLVGYIVDLFLITLIVIVLGLVLTPLLVVGASSESGAVIGSAVFLYVFVILVVSILYFPFFWARTGQTPGMRIFRLRVVRDADGGRIGWGTAFIRWIGLTFIDSIVLGLPIGQLWVLIDKRHRAWHDLIAGTCVIEQP